MEKKQIRAVYNDKTIRVYQAYPEVIAREAVTLGTFGPHFKMARMTWIKPSFLWMMYRCGWAAKEGQERVLAIDIKRTAFDYIVKNAVLSTFHPEAGVTMEEWKQMIQSSDIRCQWDPERDIWGNPLEYRSIQLGLRGQAVAGYVNDWIVSIEDITDYVMELDTMRRAGMDITKKLPMERIYELSVTTNESTDTHVIAGALKRRSVDAYSANITLKQIIQRKIAYYENDNSEEFVVVNKGYVRGFNQMLADINMGEAEFIAKYADIAKGLKNVFETLEEKTEEDIEELSGYNNAIVEVLGLLDEKYRYDVNM